MWSEFVMSQVLDRTSQGGRLRAYDSPLSLLHRVGDATLIVVSLWVVCRHTDTPWSFSMLVAGLIASLLLFLLGQAKQLYRSWRADRIFTEVWRTVEIWFFVAGISLIAIHFQKGWIDYPLHTMLLWFLVASVPLVAWRVALRLTLRIARYYGYNTRTLAIAGTGELARHVAHKVKQSPSMGFRLLGLFEDSESGSSVGERTRSLESLIAMARRGEVDVVYLALPAGLAERRIEEILRCLGDSTASVYLVRDRRSRSAGDELSSRQVLPSFGRIDVLKHVIVDLGGVRAVSVYESPFLGPDRWVKRAEDIIGSSIALCLLAIPMLIIALGVKRSSPGPVFFKQCRYGLDGKPIKVWKFRSMTVCENGEKIVQASKNDARVTPFGAFLRRTSLDELPQFFNVFLGSMSIVGPRPHAIAHNEYYRKLLGGYMLRHKVKPGITGWAQVNGFRGETATLEKMGKRVDYDLSYIRHWSIWLDIRIVVMTVFCGFAHKNAY